MFVLRRRKGLTRWYELPRDLAGLLSARVPSRRLEIRYIHARRLIKYSFAASGTTRSVFHSPSFPFNSFLTRGHFSPFLPFIISSLTLATHSSCYIRVRSLLAITPARLQIAVPPTLGINART